MYCPYCGSSQVMVVNSRPTQGGSQIWRRRKCGKCQETFTSYERANLSHLIVIKKSGKRQKFSRAKLYSGIYHSFLDKKGVDRGDASQMSEEITNKVEREIMELKSKKIASNEIMELVVKIMAKRTPDALLRYLAYRKGEEPKKLKSLIRKYF